MFQALRLSSLTVLLLVAATRFAPAQPLPSIQSIEMPLYSVAVEAGDTPRLRIERGREPAFELPVVAGLAEGGSILGFRADSEGSFILTAAMFGSADHRQECMEWATADRYFGEPPAPKGGRRGIASCMIFPMHFHYVLIHGSIAGGIERSPRRYKSNGSRLTVLRTRIGCNPRRIDTLLLHQVGFGVARPFGSELAAAFFMTAGFPYDGQRRIGALLQCERDLIEAGLCFIVHARRATRIPFEAEGAQPAGGGFRGGGRNYNSHRSSTRRGQALVIDNIAGDVDGSSRGAGGRENNRCA